MCFCKFLSKFKFKYCLEFIKFSIEDKDPSQNEFFHDLKFASKSCCIKKRRVGKTIMYLVLLRQDNCLVVLGINCHLSS